MRSNISVRAIAVDESGKIILIERTRPGRAPYWVAPGGGVETDDSDLETALRRELFEELHAEAEIGPEVLVFGDREITTHIFLAQVGEMNPELRTGPEFADPAKGTYDVRRIENRPEVLSQLNIQPRR